ncbi:MAG: hypothetical protein V4658_07160 [Bacteroidota bacterium]
MKQVSIDLSYLKTIAGDDESFIKEMLQMFLNTTPVEVESIGNYFKEGNYHMMASAAHKIKAPIQMLGDEYATGILLQIEQLAKPENDKTELPALIDEAREHLGALVSEVNKLFNTL